jgi:hypothetical protein
MPPAAAADGAAAGAAGGQGQQQQRGGFLQSIIRMLVMWYMMKMFTGGNKGQQGGAGGKDAKFLTPRLPRGHPLDMHLYISEEASWQAVAAAATPIWSTFEVPLAEQQEPRRLQYVYRPSPAVQANGSVYVHAVFVPTGASPNPKDDFFDSTATFARTSPLNVWRKKRAAKAGVNLLSGKNSTGEAFSARCGDVTPDQCESRSLKRQYAAAHAHLGPRCRMAAAVMAPPLLPCPPVVQTTSPCRTMCPWATKPSSSPT